MQTDFRSGKKGKHMNSKKTDRQMWIRVTALALAALLVFGVIFTALTAMG